jgi:hypothetical protein
MMVALVIGILVVGFALDFVLGQSRFAANHAGKEEAQQNLRGSLEIVASDLRGTLAAGVALAEDQAIEFALPQMWGVVCGVTSTTQTIAMFPAVAGAVPPTGTGAGLMVFDGAAWQPALPGRATVTGATLVPVANAPLCSAMTPQGNVVAYQLTGVNHPTTVASGDRIALYREVRYDVGASNGAQWLRRSSGGAAGSFNMQPLAGPVDPDSVSFQYLAGAAGAAPVTIAPPGTAAPTSNLRLVRFTVRTTSSQGTGTQARQDSVTVQIRN